jgi:hypothetical protein
VDSTSEEAAALDNDASGAFATDRMVAEAKAAGTSRKRLRP